MAANSSLSVVKGTACPGGDLEYTCTVSTTITMVFNIRWIHSGSTQVIYLYSDPTTLTNQSITGFSTTVSVIPPNYTLTSTATLSGALLSHDNITLQCRVFVQSPPMIDTIVTKGIILSIMLIINLVTTAVLGATTTPFNLTITSPAVLIWLPPAPNGPTDCVFNYVHYQYHHYQQQQLQLQYDCVQ